MANHIKFKNVIASSALILSGITSPNVFADTGNYQIPIGFDDRPQFELTKIDLTNNKFDFGVTQVRLPGDILTFGAWIVNDFDINNLDDLDETSLTEAFWNGDRDISSYYHHSKNTTRHYITPATVNLAEESTGKMFYMAELSDGTVWANLVDYSDCLSGWTFGKACIADTFEQEMGFATTINYVLADVEIESTEPTDPVEPEEPIGPVEPTDPVNPVDITDNPDSGQTNPTDSDLNNLDNTPVEKNTDSEEREPKVTEKIIETVKTVEVANSTTSNSLSDSSNSDGSDSSNDAETDKTEYNTDEKADESVLEVPELGKKNDNILNNLSWILIFISGMLLGTTSTWFLLSDHKKMKQNRQ